MSASVAFPITRAQLVRLQTVYEQWRKRELLDSSRETRLAEFNARLGRRQDARIASTSDLRVGEAKQLIDSFQAELQIAETVLSRRHLPRHERQKLGTEGRHDQASNETTIAGPSEIARLRRDLDRLGWDEARFEGFLGSKFSPLNGRRKLLTLADYNRVHWALKRLQAEVTV